MLNVDNDEIISRDDRSVPTSSDNNCSKISQEVSSDLPSLSPIDRIRQEALTNINDSQTRQKSYYDRNRSPAVEYSVGDLVKITKTSFQNDGKRLNNKRYESVVAADRMRPWIHIQALELNKNSGSESSSSDTDSDVDQ
ncbi:hypothetical protein ACJJTC_004628 [Scirpophaga incertulas]